MDSFEPSLNKLAKDYETEGYAIIEGFLSEQDIASLKAECLKLIDEAAKENKKNIFANELNTKNKYFIESSNKIAYFYEKDAVDRETGEFLVPRERSMAKIGHALHCLNPTFKRITTDDRVKLIFKKIGFKEPTVVQSMVIFKNPKVGGAYTPHQDASFLCSEPIRLAGIWLALDDATLENGCLQFIPGTHGWPLKRRIVRNPNADLDKDNDEFLVWTAPEIQCRDEQFIHVPVKRGSLVILHGLVVHRSASNNSDEPRWIYTFHAYDRGASRYLEDNWLAESETFMPIYTSSH